MTPPQLAAAALRDRRTARGFRTRRSFQWHLIEVLGNEAPSDRLLGALERGERTNYDTDTIRSVDLWYDLPHGTFGRWLVSGLRDDEAVRIQIEKVSARPVSVETLSDEVLLNEVARRMHLRFVRITGRHFETSDDPAVGVDVSPALYDLMAAHEAPGYVPERDRDQGPENGA